MNKLKNSQANSTKKRRVPGSLIISTLSRASQWVYKKLENGFLGNLFTSYEKENAFLKTSLISKFKSKLDLSERFVIPAKRIFARSIENSHILLNIRKMLDSMLSSSMKSYGIFVFSFALYSTITSLFRKFYLEDNQALDIVNILTLVLMLISSVAMISSRHTLKSALTTSVSFRFILFKVIGAREESFGKGGTANERFNVAFIAGLVFGIASFFVRPIILLAGIALLICAYIVLIRPECGVLGIMILVPFTPTLALVGAVLYTAVCYLLKVMCGKRSLKFDLLDIFVLLFIILLGFGGLVSSSAASLKPVLVYVAFAIGYFLVVNLIRSKEWIARCIVGFSLSASFVALYGIYQNFFGKVEQTWQDTEMFEDISGRVVSTFENPNVLAEYLIMILPLVVTIFLISKKTSQKAFGFVGTVLITLCIIYTWSRGAWLGILIGALIFLLMYSRHTLTGLLFCSLGIPFLPFVLPESITSRFLSIGNLADSSTSYRVNIWRGALRMLEDYWPSGIGVGYEAFKMVYPFYSLSGAETAQHVHNLYLQIVVELGIFALIIFIVTIFIWAQSCIELHKTETRPEKYLSNAIFCGLLAVLAQGLTDYIWYNYRVFLVFWLILGLGVAIRKNLKATAQQEIF